MFPYDYLVDHALKHVWCTPDQDLQEIVEPTKLTGLRGVMNKIQLQWSTITLPLQATRFHVYQIGQLHPLLMGLLPSVQQWMKVSDACNASKVIVDLYSNSGVQLPRTTSWYMVTENRSLIFAVQEQPGILFNQDTEALFIRVYSNAYFSSVRADQNAIVDYVKVEGGKMGNRAAILSLQSRFAYFSGLPGGCYAFVNGFKVSGIDLFTTQVNDMAEIIYDSSIYKTLEFQVKDLLTFNSILDTKRKYLIHYNGASENDIDYQDDIDIFIYQKDTAGRHKGVYYHRNMPDAVRMVTHRDYSIVVPYVLGYVAARPEWTDPLQLYVSFQIRRGGWDRPLVFENSRIHELYKLTDAQILDAMLGVDSTVDVWRAENLENAGYTQIMRSKLLEVVPDLVEKGYGYNAISKLLGDTPKFVRLASTQKVVDVPYGLANRAVGYEYDINGLLVGWFSHVIGTIYATRDFRANLVEMISGSYDTRLDETYGGITVTLDPTANYRMYMCPIVNGQATNVFTDITGGPQYVIQNNVLTWIVDRTKFLTMVRSDIVFLAYTLPLISSNGYLKFSLTSDQYRNGVLSTWVMQVPMGELDLFLNGHPLIEGIDYIVNFPQVVITNKQWLVDPANTTQKVDIRFTGFCNSDFSRENYKDVGFIDHGLLSHNGRYDIRDDKVLRIVAGGALYDRSELKFDETNAGVMIDAANGSPYLIRDIIVPLRGNTNENTYELRAKSDVIDKEVADYMSLKYPMPTFTTPNPIPGLYQVYSPFCSHLIYDLAHGVLHDDRLLHPFGDDLVLELCQPYEYLLPFDPTQDANLPDVRYVIIHPHDLYTVINLQAFMYKFMLRVVALYTKNRVNLSHFVNISET